MGEWLFFGLDVAACLWVFWVAGSYFLVRGEPHNVWGLCLQLGLIGLMASSASIPLAVWQAMTVDGRPAPSWSVLFRVSAGVVAGVFYSYRFGYRRQWGHIIETWHNLRDRVRELRHWRMR